MLDPRDFFAQHTQGTRYAIPWTLWYVSGGKDGQEPPENQKQRMKLFDEARATADLKKRGEIMKQVFDLAAEAFETVGVCLAVNTFGIVQEQPGQRAEEEAGCLVLARIPAPSMPQQYLLHDLMAVRDGSWTEGRPAGPPSNDFTRSVHRTACSASSSSACSGWCRRCSRRASSPSC